jgi:hypothetical protein
MNQLVERAVDKQIDWERAFYDFCDAHSQPVEHGGLFLFSDGWRHSISDRGPSYPPPSEPDELRELQLQYWRIRKNIVLAERSHCELERMAYIQKQAGRVSPLPLKNGERLNLAELDERISWLISDAEECSIHVESLCG